MPLAFHKPILLSYIKGLRNSATVRSYPTVRSNTQGRILANQTPSLRAHSSSCHDTLSAIGRHSLPDSDLRIPHPELLGLQGFCFRSAGFCKIEHRGR